MFDVDVAPISRICGKLFVLVSLYVSSSQTTVDMVNGRLLDAFVVVLNQACEGGENRSLVCIYIGAAAGVSGLLRGMQGCPDADRACRERNTPGLMVSMAPRELGSRTGPLLHPVCFV